MIKNIVFDMGNVLIYFRPAEYINRLGVNESDAEFLLQNVFKAEEWLHLDDGTMTEMEIVESVCRRTPERLHECVRKLVLAWFDPLLPIPGMAELVKELKNKGYCIYLLSNAGANQHKYWNDVPGSEYFDGTLISADVKTVKPDPEIYRLLFGKFSIKPEESIFIDDSEPNILAGKGVGMEGIVYTDTADLRQALKSLDIL